MTDSGRSAEQKCAILSAIHGPVAFCEEDESDVCSRRGEIARKTIDQTSGKRKKLVSVPDPGIFRSGNRRAINQWHEIYYTNETHHLFFTLRFILLWKRD